MAKKSAQGDQSQLVAILSYITLIGWIVALVLNSQKKSSLGSFHIRQSLLIMLVGIIGSFIFWIPLIGWALWILLVIMWVMGLVSAINKQEKEVMIIGKLAQDWFKAL